MIAIAVVAVGILASSCGGSKGEDVPPTPPATPNGWVLASLDGSEAMAGKVYLQLENGSFSVYQNIDEVGFETFKGTYQITDGVLSGKYNDNTAWREDYAVSGMDTSAMTLTGKTSGEVSVFAATVVPAYVKVAVAADSRAAGCRFF